MQTANETIRDKSIAHAIYLERYYSGTTRRVMELLREVEKDLIRQLKTLDIDKSSTIQQVDKQLESVQSILSEGYQLAGRDLLQEMKDAAEYEQEWQQKTINAALPIELNIVAVAPATLFAAVEDKPFEGKILKEWIDKLDTTSFESIQTSVRMGLVEGQSYDDIVRRIVGTKALQYADGTLALNRRKTQALVSTAVAHSVNAARSEFYSANDDLIKGVQIVATLDGRTTLLCKSLDGKVYPLNEGKRPPFHFRCRSTTTPVMKSWKEMGMKEPPAGTRASMSGQVAENETYQTWLQKQPHSFQDETLGKARAEMFRNGTPLDRFVDDSGKTYTLEQLRKLD